MNQKKKSSTTSKGKAVVILSGGLDSTTVAYMASAEGYELYGLTIDYGQTLVREIDCARLTADSLGFARHEVVSIPEVKKIWSGSLVDGKPIPKDRDYHSMSRDVPDTYVTFRNGCMLSLAGAFAESVGATKIFGGWNVIDYSGYPDCRREFLKSMEESINLGTKAGTVGGERVTIEYPLVFMNKRDIIKMGLVLGVDYGKTWSCYVGGESPCGSCDSCILRVQGFKEAGVSDPGVVE